MYTGEGELAEGGFGTTVGRLRAEHAAVEAVLAAALAAGVLAAEPAWERMEAWLLSYRLSGLAD